MFNRNGEDVIADGIRFYEAANGITLEIPTLEGKAKLKIPAGIQSSSFTHERQRFSTDARILRGDQLVRVHVGTQKISSKQKVA